MRTVLFTAVLGMFVATGAHAATAHPGQVEGYLPLPPNQIQKPQSAPQSNNSNGVTEQHQFTQGNYRYDVTFAWNSGPGWQLKQYAATRIGTSDLNGKIFSQVKAPTEKSGRTVSPNHPAPGPGDFSPPPYTGVSGESRSAHFDNYHGYTVDISWDWHNQWVVSSFKETLNRKSWPPGQTP